MKKNYLAMLLVLATALSGCAMFAEPTEPAPTEPLPVIAAHEVESLQDNELIESYLTGSLYELSSDGSETIPDLAASLPADVTAEYAGQFGLPAEAVRGYAFRIDLNTAPCWEDGIPITADDYVETLTALLQNEEHAADFSVIANADAYRSGTMLPGENVVSLADSGIESVAEAENLGISHFYVDVGTFWGLDAEWLPLDDTTRLKDYAMPAGLDEQYVSAAWLYREYLADGAAYDYLQSEFVGIPAEMGDEISLEDVGILKTGEHQITFILNTPSTAEYLAVALMELTLSNRENLSYGPYCLASQDASLVELERNENWWGETAEYTADIIRFRTAG